MDPITLALLGLPALYKGVQGLTQRNEANNLQKRDTTTEAEREALGLTRQAASATLPGSGQQLNRLDAGMSSTLSAAERAGTNASSIMGLLTSADQTRNQGLADLATRQDAFHQYQQRALVGQLQQKAQHERADQQTFDQNKAALREASQRNLYGALDGITQVGAYGVSKFKAAADPATTPYGLKSDLIKTAGNKVAAADGPIVSGPDDILVRRRKLSASYGVPDYGLSGLNNLA